MSKAKPQIYTFDNFRLDARERLLLCDGEPVQLPAKAFDLLLALIENGRRLVGKEELYQRVWADQIVEESNLTVQMSAIRKALGERRDHPRYIVTVPGHGYRFVGDVTTVGEDREVVIVTDTVSRLVIEKDEKVDRSQIAKTDSQEGGLGTGGVTSRQWTEGLVRKVALALAAVFIFSGVALLGFSLWSKPVAPAQLTPGNPIKSIAVLPFKPLVAENRDESLEMGMADTLIARLSNIRELNVRPISAVRRYAGLEQDALAAGREQKVDAVLDGQIQRSGDRIRVTVRLVGVGNGATLWADTFDDRLTDIFAVEDSISERVTGMLAVKLTGEERALVVQHSTNNTEAYQLYLKGRYFWNKRTGEAIKKSIDYFNQAVEKDPNYALAYAGLADSYAALSNYSVSTPQEAYSKARAAAMEALKRNNQLAEAYTALANIKTGHDWDFVGAEREYQRAIELNPNYAIAHNWYGEYLGLMGHSTKAIAEIRRAQEIEPLSLMINTNLGTLLYYAGRFDESIDQLRKTLDLDSSFGRAHIELGYAYRQKRQYEEAISEFRKALDIDGEDSYALSQLAHTYGVIGQKDDAYKAIKQLKELSKRKYVLPSDIAAAYAGLGEKDQAFKWLEKAFTDRDDGIPYLKVDPSWDGLRQDPRFRDLLRRVGFPE